MPSLAFAGSQTIASSTAGQPVFGTTTTAAVSPTYDQFAGNVTGANPSMTTLTVASTSGFYTGDYVLVAASYQFGVANPNVGQVKNIVSSTSMIVEGLTQSVPNGAYVLLNETAETITVLAKSTNSGSLYIGTAQTISSTDPSLIYIITPSNVTGYHAETSGRGHAYNTANYWIAGTVSDVFTASFSQG